MRIWILQTGEPLHTDGGYPRPMRAMNLASVLADRGHDVTLWSSAFYHQERKHRAREFQQIKVSDQLTINLVPSPGYSRNIGLGRLYDHAVLGLNLWRLLRSNAFTAPDVGFVGFPPIESAAVMVRWLSDRRVPVMVDAKDQWPTIFLEPLPSLLRPVGRLALLPYFALTKRAFRQSSAFCSMSDDFIEWMCLLSGRDRRRSDHAAPLSSPTFVTPPEQLDQARRWWLDRGVDTSKGRYVSFVGSFSAAFDFSIVAALAKRCLADGIDAQFVICGDGGQASLVSSLIGDLGNVVMPGWIDTPKIAALMAGSRAIIAPYINNDAFSRSVPNKIVDAFSTGRPVLTTLSGLTAQTLATHQIGVGSGSEEVLFRELSRLFSDHEYFDGVSRRARAVYVKDFSFERVYGDLADALTQLANPKASDER